MESGRALPWDWYPGAIPHNAVIADTAYIETTFSFYLYRSEAPVGIRIGHGASAYLGTMFDVGPEGRICLGEYALVHGARIICDCEVTIGAYCLISWNVVLMDTYRVPLDPTERRRELSLVPLRVGRHLRSTTPAKPINIGRNVWIGFDSCILPGVSIGEGSIVGARSVVKDDVEPFTIVAGNPARVIRRFREEEIRHDAKAN
jgi:acetyltransferase-like isoleucine patch superfamily enzyme